MEKKSINISSVHIFVCALTYLKVCMWQGRVYTHLKNGVKGSQKQE